MTVKRECAYCLEVAEVRDDRFICVRCEQRYATAHWNLVLSRANVSIGRKPRLTLRATQPQPPPPER
jgi:hypothetical protein